jgi:hypothetical protein
MTTKPACPTYKRVLLKLSGEAFGGGKVGLDPDVVRGIAAQIASAPRLASRWPLSSVVATSSGAPSSSAGGWTEPAPTTWACSASS